MRSLTLVPTSNNPGGRGGLRATAAFSYSTQSTTASVWQRSQLAVSEGLPNSASI